jgi:hypothetical protein
MQRASKAVEITSIACSYEKQKHYGHGGNMQEIMLSNQKAYGWPL